MLGPDLPQSASIEVTNDINDIIWDEYDDNIEFLEEPLWCTPQELPPAAMGTSGFALPQSLAHDSSVELNRGLTRRQRGQQARRITIMRNTALKRQQECDAEAAARIQQQAESFRQAQAAEANRIELMRRILLTLTAELCANGLDFGDLLVYAFDPFSGIGNWRWEQFWRCPNNFERLMRHWLSPRATESGRNLFTNFSVDLVVRMLRREAQQVTASGSLKESLEETSSPTANGFSLDVITKDLHNHCPTTVSILSRFCTSSTQRKKQTAVGIRRKEKVVAIAALSLLKEYNRRNNKFQIYSSLFLYASGVSRQGISVVSSYGSSTSYSKLISRPHYEENSMLETKSDVTTRRRKTGTLFSLSQACRKRIRHIAAERPIGLIYDNININFTVAEQVIGKIDTLESGTCATAFELFKADPQDMQVSDLTACFDQAPPLTLEDFQLSPEEVQLHQRCVVHTILDIIVNYGGVEFKRYQSLLDSHLPSSSHKRELHHDQIHPLPAMHIDESTVKGNIEICSALFKELGFDTSKPEFQKLVRLLAGDQLTIARLRAIAKNRMGHESGYESFGWLTQIIGLFHLKMAQTQGILETHLGNSNSSRNPTSLMFQQTLLHRKPLPTPIPFRTSRDLIRVSLYARILYCLLLVSGASDLAALSEELSKLDSETGAKPSYDHSFARLTQLAEKIYSKYVDRKKVYHLRQQRKNAPKPSSAGDMIFEDSTLFLCDSLDLEEFMSAVKLGDSGRVLISLKLWAFAFRANGRSKYAHEMLFLIHNITHVWSPALRDIILNNWLINPTGKPNSHVELDLVQEHLIFWIKTMYKAHGSNTSWEWLANISPCVNFLRKLAKEFHSSLGDDQGTHHSPADLTKSIETLMRTFAANEVHTVKQGRNRAEGDGAPVVDILTEGMRSLVHDADGPIAKFNQALARLQQRRRLPPVTCKVDKPVLSNPVADAKHAAPDEQNPTTSSSNRATPVHVQELLTGRPDTLNPKLGHQESENVGLGRAPQTGTTGSGATAESRLEPRGEGSSGVEPVYESTSERDAESSSEPSSVASSDGLSEDGRDLDLEFELGDELRAPIFELEYTQDDEMVDEDSGEETDAESEVDSLVGGL